LNNERNKTKNKGCKTRIKETYELIHLFVPYLWYVLTKTRVKIMCDENIKSPHPYITPWGTAWGKTKWVPKQQQWQWS